MFATGELADAGDDFGAMVEELVADDGMAGEHEEAVALDRHRV